MRAVRGIYSHVRVGLQLDELLTPLLCSLAGWRLKGNQSILRGV